MAHDAVLREKAKDMFVVNGFSMDTIQTMLPEISRKTLYNWRETEKWEEQRRSRVKSTTDIRHEIEAGLKEAVIEWRLTKNPSMMFSIGKAIEALRKMSTFNLPEEKQKEQDKISDTISDDTWAIIEERFGL
jgi:hypothetical protein